MVEADTPKGHNVDGVASLRALEARHGALPATLTATGAAGIAAARRIATAGRSYVVLEASDRWGGRCFTDMRTFGIPYERGARWIYMPDTNPMAKLAITTGATLSEGGSFLHA
jgi:heterodisulfide reductase subunit A-like polyferredoxin